MTPDDPSDEHATTPYGDYSGSSAGGQVTLAHLGHHGLLLAEIRDAAVRGARAHESVAASVRAAVVILAGGLYLGGPLSLGCVLGWVLWRS